MMMPDVCLVGVITGCSILLSAAVYVVWIYACDTARTAQHAPTHDVNAILSWNDDNCFWSSSYADARDKFVAVGNALRDQLKQAGSLGQTHAMDVVEVKSAAYDVFVDSKCAEESYKKTRIYTDEMQPVAAGKDTVDVLLMTMRVHPAQAEKLNIICTSGVHGVEGYAGSAVQIWFLREILHEQQKILSQPGQQCDKSTWDTRQIMLIHAVNPFGMRNFRRFNENNCDLNRNALTPEELRQAQARDPTSTGYPQLDYLFNPFYAQNKDGSPFSWVDSYGAKCELPAASRSADSERALHQADARNQAQIAASVHRRSFRVECWEMARILGLLLFEMVRTGPALVKRALVGGQYLKSTGVWYGGDKLENSILAVTQAIRDPELFGFKQNDSRAVCWVDLHTGLGEYGSYQLIADGAVSDGYGAAQSNVSAWQTELVNKIGKVLGKEKLALGNTKVASGYDFAVGCLPESYICRSGKRLLYGTSLWHIFF